MIELLLFLCLVAVLLLCLMMVGALILCLILLTAVLHMLHDIDLREIFEYAHLKFMVSGRPKQASKHTHTCAQYSPASVGLAQARPNHYD